jgi:glycerol-3-phosphate dehydrogenase (NAD(P)+)
MADINLKKVAIIGPGRLGTAFAYKFGRDGKDVMIYYHSAELCEEINRTHINPKHLTNDLAKKLGGIDKVPKLPPRIFATNDLERIMEENDLIFLSVTMNKLPDLLYYLKPIIVRKKTKTYFISPIKGLASEEKTRELITPSQMINNHFFDIRHKFEIICMGGPFFDVDIAMGKPVCVNVAGKKTIAREIKSKVLDVNKRELTSYYNFDIVGVEACGALKNIVANLKGIVECLSLGDSIPGTLFARSGVEIRSMSKLLGGSFQSFYSQAGVGDMYVTLSSDASKNFRYGKLFYELFNGNPIETNINVLAKIDGTPEGPNTIKNVHRYLEKKNMYSPLFHCAYKIFNEGRSKEEILERVIQATQFDKRAKEYISPISRVLYRLIPNLWYRRYKGFLSRFNM